MNAKVCFYRRRSERLAFGRWATGLYTTLMPVYGSGRAAQSVDTILPFVRPPVIPAVRLTQRPYTGYFLSVDQTNPLVFGLYLTEEG